LTQREQEYLDAAIERRRNQEAEESERAARQGRLERSARSRLIALAVAIALVLAATGGSTLLWLRSRPPDVALVFAGPGDTGFNDIIASGFDRAASEFGVRTEKVVVPDERRWDEYERLSDEGVDLIVASDPGCTAPGFVRIAITHPETNFVLTDCLGKVPSNIAQIWFASEEGSFLAGAVAASKSVTGSVGFVGGMDFPLIWAFGAGFEAGAHYIDPTIEVQSTYLSAYPDYSGFTSPRLASQAATRMYRQGADVIYHAAGRAGIGVFQAAFSESEAQGRHLWAIGVDTDQYRAVMGLNPDFDPSSWQPHILTSMVKRYGRLTYASVAEYSQGQFFPRLRVFGLAEGAVDIVYTGGFIDEFRPIIEELRRLIIAGEIDVPTVPTDRRLEAANWPSQFTVP
jgi:basic membrane protein A